MLKAVLRTTAAAFILFPFIRLISLDAGGFAAVPFSRQPERRGSAEHLFSHPLFYLVSETDESVFKTFEIQPERSQK